MTDNERESIEYRRRYYIVEQTLKNLSGYKLSIDILQARIDEIEGDCDEHLLSAVNTANEAVSKTNAIHSMVETDALLRVEGIEKLTHKIKRSEQLVILYDKALSILHTDEQMVVSLRYFEGQQWWQIAGACHMSERAVKYKRKNAINKMIVAIYGDDEVCTNIALRGLENVI